MKQDATTRSKSGLIILACFLGFFGTVGAVDAYFVYTAIHTNTGVVTEQAYEKGLAYNTVLDKARNQPALYDKAIYQKDIFTWQARDLSGQPAQGANVKVRFVRPVQDGHDFEVLLEDKGNGIYSTASAFPMKGLWQAQISAQWNNTQYQTTRQFIVR